MTTPEFKLGAAEARIDALSVQMKELKDDVLLVKADVHDIKLTLARVEGAWKFAVKAAALLSSMLGIVIGFIVRLVTER